MIIKSIEDLQDLLDQYDISLNEEQLVAHRREFERGSFLFDASEPANHNWTLDPPSALDCCIATNKAHKPALLTSNVVRKTESWSGFDMLIYKDKKILSIIIGQTFTDKDGEKKVDLRRLHNSSYWKSIRS